VRVERTGDGKTRRPPVLKTGRITGPHALPGDAAADGEDRNCAARLLDYRSFSPRQCTTDNGAPG